MNHKVAIIAPRDEPYAKTSDQRFARIKRKRNERNWFGELKKVAFSLRREESRIATDVLMNKAINDESTVRTKEF